LTRFLPHNEATFSWTQVLPTRSHFLTLAWQVTCLHIPTSSSILMLGQNFYASPTGISQYYHIYWTTNYSLVNAFSKGLGYTDACIPYQWCLHQLLILVQPLWPEETDQVCLSHLFPYSYLLLEPISIFLTSSKTEQEETSLSLL
jgi:hypothetical protein